MKSKYLFICKQTYTYIHTYTLMYEITLAYICVYVLVHYFEIPLPFVSLQKWHHRAFRQTQKRQAEDSETYVLNFFFYCFVFIFFVFCFIATGVVLFYCADDLKLGVGLHFFPSHKLLLAKFGLLWFFLLFLVSCFALRFGLKL